MADAEAARKAKQAEYAKNHREKKGRAASFRLEFSGDDTVRKEILDKFFQVKSQLGDPRDVTNLEVIRQVLNYYLHHTNVEEQGPCEDPPPTNAYLSVSREDVDQSTFLTTIQSCNQLANIAADHCRKCPKALFSAEEKYRRGHGAALQLQCKSCKSILPNWHSSPYLPNGKYLVNYRMMHGYFCSGMSQSV